MVAVLVATGASPAMTYTLKLLTDAAVACGQGPGRRRAPLAQGARVPRGVPRERLITVVIALEQRIFFLGQNLTQAVSSHGQVAEGLEELLQPHEITDRPAAAPGARGP